MFVKGGKLVPTACALFHSRSRLSTSSPVWRKLTWSYLQGESPQPLMGVTVGQLLQDAATKTPDKKAFVFPEAQTSYTFRELLKKSDQLAAGLVALGVKPGDRVGIWSPNHPHWVITQYAAARAGFILVNLNPAYRTNEIEYALRKVGVTAVVCPESLKTTKYYDMLHEICPELDSAVPGNLTSKRLPTLKSVIAIDDQDLPGTFKFSDVMQAGTHEHQAYISDLQYKIQFDEPANIQFTSGTTGSPKGATLSHHSITNNGYFIGCNLQYNKSDAVVCSPVPLYHCFGTVLASLQSVIHGSTVVIPAALPDPRTTVQAIQQEKCTSLYGTPTMFIDILNLPDFDQFDFSSLHTGIMAGSPCPPEVMKDVINKMNMKDITICYGTTENSPVTFQTTFSDSFQRKVGTVGRPLAHTEVKVVDEDDHVVPIGQRGELMVRGPWVMLGYYDDPEKTQQVITADRWYRTGDIVTLDENGYGKIEGRISDMYIRGGENVYPVEVEGFIHTHPDVVDVQVVGVPDKRLGEEGCACIVMREGASLTEKDIKEFCKGKMTHFKIPRYIKFVEDYPMTVTKKVQKFVLREMMCVKLGLER